MDHVVYVNAKTKEPEKLLSGIKTKVIRGAAGRRMPHGRVDPGDALYFMRNNAEGLVHARGWVTEVIHSEKLSASESARLIQDNLDSLQLTPVEVARWSGKRYLVLITVAGVEDLEPFAIDRSAYGNMDDWLPVGDISTVRA